MFFLSTNNCQTNNIIFIRFYTLILLIYRGIVLNRSYPTHSFLLTASSISSTSLMNIIYWNAILYPNPSKPPMHPSKRNPEYLNGIRDLKKNSVCVWFMVFFVSIGNDFLSRRRLTVRAMLVRYRRQSCIRSLLLVANDRRHGHRPIEPTP